MLRFFKKVAFANQCTVFDLLTMHKDIPEDIPEYCKKLVACIPLSNMLML